MRSSLTGSPYSRAPSRRMMSRMVPLSQNTSARMVRTPDSKTSAMACDMAGIVM